MPIKIELRNVAYNARLSEETPAYKADVWIDGVKAGTTRNSGTGGANITEPHALGERLKAHAATLPKDARDKPSGGNKILKVTIRRS